MSEVLRHSSFEKVCTDNFQIASGVHDQNHGVGWWTNITEEEEGIPLCKFIGLSYVSICALPLN